MAEIPRRNGDQMIPTLTSVVISVQQRCNPSFMKPIPCIPDRGGILCSTKHVGVGKPSTDVEYVEHPTHEYDTKCY